MSSIEEMRKIFSGNSDEAIRKILASDQNVDIEEMRKILASGQNIDIEKMHKIFADDPYKKFR